MNPQVCALVGAEDGGDPAEFWCWEARMGQQASVPADTEETLEVLSTVSGRAVSPSGGRDA